MATAKVDSAQRRRRLEQLVQNDFPGCVVVFLPSTDGSVAFRIRAKNGRYRSGAIKLMPHHRAIRLNKSWLERALRMSLPRRGKAF